jgi:hypothetical protein
LPDGSDTGPVILMRRIREASDRLKFGEFKRECFTRLKNDGSISHVVEAATSETQLRHYIENFLHRAFMLTSAVGRNPENDPSEKLVGLFV